MAKNRVLLLLSTTLAAITGIVIAKVAFEPKLPAAESKVSFVEHAGDGDREPRAEIVPSTGSDSPSRSRPSSDEDDGATRGSEDQETSFERVRTELAREADIRRTRERGEALRSELGVTRLSVHVREASLASVLVEIADASQVSVMAVPSLTREKELILPRVEFEMAPMEAILDYVAEQSGLDWTTEGSVVLFVPRTTSLGLLQCGDVEEAAFLGQESADADMRNWKVVLVQGVHSFDAVFGVIGNQITVPIAVDPQLRTQDRVVSVTGVSHTCGEIESLLEAVQPLVFTLRYGKLWVLDRRP